MRLPAALALASTLSLSLAFGGEALAKGGGARRPGPEHGAALEKADRVEREGKALLEKGDRPQGARLLAEAWQIRARVFAAQREQEEKAAGAKESGPAPEAGADLAELARRTIEKLGGDPDDASLARAIEGYLRAIPRTRPDDGQGGFDPAFRAARVKAAHLDEAAREARAAGRLDEAERLEAKAAAIRAEAAKVRDRHDHEAKHPHADHLDHLRRRIQELESRAPRAEQLDHLRRRIEDLKERSAELERKGKWLRGEGHEDSARRAMRESGETWAEARELERKAAQDLPDPRGDDAMRRAKEEATFVERGGAGPAGVPPFEGRRRAVVLHAQERVEDLRADVARLREEMRRMRALLDELRQELRGRKEAAK
jgi:hypothetical protein